MADRVSFTLRTLCRPDWDEFAELICVSMNFWYRAHGLPAIFPKPEATRVYLETYDTLDPDGCVVAEHPVTRRLMGGCFFHIRESHVSLGMMAVHPNHFSGGVGRALVKHITDLADARGLPTRLISSAMNLDSYSLYTRSGFVPRRLFQDILIKVPEGGMPALLPQLHDARAARDATAEDVNEMTMLEAELTGVRRPSDLAHFIANARGCWHISALHGIAGLEGFLASYSEGSTCLVGPGVARDTKTAAALLQRELSRHAGETALMLIPADSADLVTQAYAWGGRNIELHVTQVRGECIPQAGIVLPTFLPETA